MSRDSDTSPSQASMNGGVRDVLPVAAAGLSCLLLGLWIQTAGGGLLGVDGYYHIKMAALTLREGMPLDFPYLPFTVLDGERFWDMHMLFHVLQAPFTLIEDLGWAAKGSTAFWFAAALAVMYWVLRRYRVPLPWLWVLLLLAASEGFLYRMGMPRAQVFGVIYTFIAFHLLMERRVVGLGVLALLFTWTYKGFLILGPLTLFGVAAHYLESRRVEYGLVVAVAAGIAAGLVVNPYFPNDVLFLWRDVLEKIIAGEYVTNVGGEWFPYDTRELIAQAGLALLAYIAALVLISPRTGQWDKTDVFWALTATFWLVMVFKSKRFVEYFPPAAVMFLAVSCRSWIEEFRPRAWLSSPVKCTGGVAVVVLLVVLVYRNAEGVRADLEQEPPASAYGGAAGWLAANTPPGTRVFHTDWDMFPMLFFHNSHNTYIVGLDPDYMRLDHPLLYGLWSDISDGHRPGVMDRDILEVFESEYVFTDNGHEEFVRLADSGAAFSEAYSDSYATVYRIVRPPALDDELGSGGPSAAPQGPGLSETQPLSRSEPPVWW